MIPEFRTSCKEMIEQWKQMVINQENCELDVWPQLQKLTADAISRAAFGTNYEQGKKIFRLQKELIQLTLEAMQTFYIPGLRYFSHSPFWRSFIYYLADNINI